jgi:hypothetical protein
MGEVDLDNEPLSGDDNEVRTQRFLSQCGGVNYRKPERNHAF